MGDLMKVKVFAELDQWAVDTLADAKPALQKLRCTSDTKVYVNGVRAAVTNIRKSDDVACVVNPFTKTCSVVHVTRRTPDGGSEAG